MPWQLFGNGRSDWSTKLTRGLEAETAAGFQSRRGRCREPTPVTPQYATFQTYKAARVHHAHRRYGGMATRGARAAGSACATHRHTHECGQRRAANKLRGFRSTVAAIGLDRRP